MTNTDTSHLTAQADDALARGNLTEALALYRQICNIDGNNADAWMMLGAISAELGNLPSAVASLEQAIALDANNASACFTLASVQRAQGLNDEALRQLQRAVTLDADYAEAWSMMGGIYGQRGENEQAAECSRRAVTLQPDYLEAHMNLGNATLQLGRLDEAAMSYRVVVTGQPDFALPWLLLGKIAMQSSDFENAKHSLQRALTLDPAQVEAHVALGRLLKQEGDVDAAINVFRQAIVLNPDLADAHYEIGKLLADRGMGAEAVSHYQRAIELVPAFIAAHSGLGSALQTLGRHAQAIESYRRALQLAPKTDSAELNTNLSNSYRLLGLLDEAEVCLREALRHNPTLAEAHNNLGSVLKAQGRMEEAIAALQRALELKPDFIGAQSNYLLDLNYLPSSSPEGLFRAHQVWGMQQERAVTAPRSYSNVPDPERRLRIGYVSPDLRTHAVANFLQPIMENHNAARFHITCYAEVFKPDEVTAHLRGLAHAWQSSCGLSDAQLVELIRRDGIDILVDLAGHTAHNRLAVFATKPAPVQFSYLGYPNTTGLSRIDYRLTDVIADPPDAQQYYTEQLLYLDGGFTCFAPPQGVPAVSALPAQRNGHVTFGSVSNLCKVNDQVLDMWCGVLRAIPSARFLFYRHLLKGSARDRLQQAFEARGISRERVALLAEIPPEYQALPFGKRYYGFFERIDIVLDTLPWNGHTTTCETLWMGVPVVTLLGDRHAGRICASVLTTVGLPELIARDADEFVRIAAALAQDPDSLGNMRSTLRERVRKSVLCDGTTFTHKLELAYRETWQRWCAAD